MALAAPPTVVADLVLVRLALPAPKPPAPSTLRRDVGKLLHGRDLTADEFAAVRDDLAVAGMVEAAGRSVRLTAAGRARARDFLGFREFPSGTTWATVEARHLFPTAAGLPVEAAQRLNSTDRLAAFLLRRKYGLPAAAGATMKQVLESLACRELGHPDETTLDGLMRTVVSRLIGSDERLTKEQLTAQVPLFETGLTKVAAAEIRRLVIRAGLTGAEPEPPAEFDLAAFARTVTALARTCPPAERFHDNKVFIAAVWRASQRESGFPRLRLPEFKARLVEANRAGQLRLSRADLVQAMDPALVAESETRYLNATFHFVLIEGDRP